jgi:AcrR family transcriptional regulator
MDTSRARFLAAADHIFIEHGYRGTTIRAICAEAGTSLAILNRNWGDKESLFREVLRRHFDPIHNEQSRRLASLVAPSIEDVLIAFYEPAFTENEDLAGTGRSVYCRALVDPAREMKILVAELIGDVRQALTGQIRRAIDERDDHQFFLVMNIVMGAFIYPQNFGHQLAVSMNFDDRSVDWSNAARSIAKKVAAAISNADQ